MSINPEKIELRFEEEKPEEIVEKIEKEEVEETKEEILEIDYSEKAEQEVKTMKKQYGEVVQEAGLSEEVFDQAETKLKKEAESFQQSENKPQKEKKNKLTGFFKKTTKRFLPYLAAAGIFISGIGGAEARVVPSPEKKVQVEVVIERAKDLREQLSYLNEKGGVSLSIGGEMSVINKIIENEELSEKRKIEIIKKLYDEASPSLEIIEKETEAGLEKIMGFEKLGIENEFLKKIIKETYPKTWIGPDVSQVVYKNEERPGSPRTVAVCKDLGPHKEAEITFYKPASEMDSYDEFLWTLSHELAHANDWDSDSQLFPEERVKFLYAVSKRLESKDQFNSGYVLMISNPDEQKEWYLKCVEYWAEICGEYLTDPESEFLPEPDRVLIEDYLGKTDPDFDAVKAKELRDNMVKDYIK